MDPHISDHELTQLIDGELESAQLTQHVARCWTCRARRSELEQTIAELVQSQRTISIPSSDGPAALLRARMHEAKPVIRPVFLPWKIAAAVASAGVFAYLLLPHGIEPALPNSRLTPGAVRVVSRDQVCATNRLPSRVPAELAGQVFLEYGIDHPRPKAYEVDYLITPALGGADDIHNLWPQPYTGSVWTAPVKDALESYLVSQVCDGQLDLKTAQHEIATNWIAAYRKYFHTARPLAAHLASATDNPWE